MALAHAPASGGVWGVDNMIEGGPEVWWFGIARGQGCGL